MLKIAKIFYITPSLGVLLPFLPVVEMDREDAEAEAMVKFAVAHPVVVDWVEANCNGDLGGIYKFAQQNFDLQMLN